MIHELDAMVLNYDLPAVGLEVGNIGTVVLDGQNEVGHEVEFTTLSGGTMAIQRFASRPT